jgi:hypothetical protein
MNWLTRILSYQYGAHQVDWIVLGAILILAFALWAWSAIRLAAKLPPQPPQYCRKCGQSWAIHNDDGSCIDDYEDFVH